MKRMLTSVLAAAALVGLCTVSGAFAAGKMDAKTKAANSAHSDAPAPVTAGAPATGAAATGNMATGEGMQGMMSPEMTKFIASMKTCHKGGKTNQKCHDGVIKSCEAKMTKGECSQIMSAVHSDEKKM